MELLQRHQMSLDDVIADTVDHRAMTRSPEIRNDPVLQGYHMDLHIMQGLAPTVRANFYRSFNALFPKGN
jgi:hypothetical protein